MNISIGDAIGQGWKQMEAVCFRPFEPGKWFGLGFAAWLANLTSTGTSGLNLPLDQIPWEGPEKRPPSVDALLEYLILTLPIVLAVAAGAILLLVILSWLSARGHFMFLYGVANNDGSVSKAWSEYSREATSLFFVRTVLGVFFVLALGAVTIAALQMLESMGEMQGIAVAAGLVLVTFLLFAVLDWVLLQLIVPIMYARRCGFGDALELLRERVFSVNMGAVFLYGFTTIGLGIATAIVASLVLLFTCCLAALPYLGTVILLPTFVFLRATNLAFVQQYSPDFQFFATRVP